MDYNHVECTSACITALHAFAARHPGHRRGEIARALARGVEYLKRWVGGRTGVIGWVGGLA